MLVELEQRLYLTTEQYLIVRIRQTIYLPLSGIWWTSRLRLKGRKIIFHVCFTKELSHNLYTKCSNSVLMLGLIWNGTLDVGTMSYRKTELSFIHKKILPTPLHEKPRQTVSSSVFGKHFKLFFYTHLTFLSYQKMKNDQVDNPFVFYIREGSLTVCAVWILLEKTQLISYPSVSHTFFFKHSQWIDSD